MPARHMRFRDWAAIAALAISGIFLIVSCGWLLSLIVTGRSPARWHADPAVIPAKVVQYSLGITSGLFSVARAYLYHRDKTRA